MESTVVPPCAGAIYLEEGSTATFGNGETALLNNNAWLRGGVYPQGHDATYRINVSMLHAACVEAMLVAVHALVYGEASVLLHYNTNMLYTLSETMV